MRESRRILSYAKRDTDATFQLNEDAIYIYSGYGRVYRYVSLAVAAGMFVLMLAMLLHGADSKDPRKTLFGCVIMVLVIAACVSSGWWWTDARLDFAKRELTVENRWGAFHTRRVVSFDRLERVELEHDDAGAWNVGLIGRGSRWIIAWGRGFSESVPIARTVAARLNVPVSGDECED